MVSDQTRERRGWLTEADIAAHVTNCPQARKEPCDCRCRYCQQWHPQDPKWLHDPTIEEMEADMTEASKLALGLMKADPKLAYPQAFVIAKDRLGVDRAFTYMSRGATFEEVYTLVGSYGRLDFVVRALADGKVDKEWVLDRLPDLWRGSDPDDTDPRFVALWRQAWLRNGQRPVCDGDPLPLGKVIRVYRGQDADAPKGIAWTTDLLTAIKFARGAGSRQATRGGVILDGLVLADRAFGYLTGRGESEVVVHPDNVAAIVEFDLDDDIPKERA